MLTVFPVANLGNRLAVISDGFGSPRDGGSRKHLGVDVMVRRIPSDIQPVGDGQGSPHYVMPKGHPALAAGPGRAIMSESTGTGWTVKLDHGGGLVSVYRHLIRGMVSVGATVKEGQIVGPIGHNPSGGADPNHLHFEIVVNGNTVDPEPYLRNLKHISASTGVLLIAALVGGVLAAKYIR